DRGFAELGRERNRVFLVALPPPTPATATSIASEPMPTAAPRGQRSPRARARSPAGWLRRIRWSGCIERRGLSIRLLLKRRMVLQPRLRPTCFSERLQDNLVHDRLYGPRGNKHDERRDLIGRQRPGSNRNLGRARPPRFGRPGAPIGGHPARIDHARANAVG